MRKLIYAFLLSILFVLLFFPKQVLAQTFDCFNGSCVIGTTYPDLPTCQANCVKLPNLKVTCAGGLGIDTAIGCLPAVNTTQNFLGFIVPWSIGIAGGIAFIMMVFAGFTILTSSGNPQKLNAGKELLTSAILGLVLLIFAAFILRVIGKDILGIFK